MWEIILVGAKKINIPDVSLFLSILFIKYKRSSLVLLILL